MSRRMTKEEWKEKIQKHNEHLQNKFITTEYPSRPYFVDKTGQKYGRLTVIKYAGKAYIGDKIGIFYWCECECGNKIIVSASSLACGNTKSCGCLAVDTTVALNTTHGMSKTKDFKNNRLYSIWCDMRSRCRPPTPKTSPRLIRNYYAKGIRVCPEWDNLEDGFINFYHWATEVADPPYADNLTIDRIDPDGDYCPENCRWLTISEQENNKSNTRYITYGYFSFNPAIWAKIIGVKKGYMEFLYENPHHPERLSDDEIIRRAYAHIGIDISRTVIEIPPEYAKFNAYYRLHPEDNPNK